MSTKRPSETGQWAATMRLAKILAAIAQQDVVDHIADQTSADSPKAEPEQAANR